MRSGSVIACLASGGAMLTVLLAFGGGTARSQNDFPTPPPPPPGSFDQAFQNLLGFKVTSDIQIAPMVKKGSATEGTWTGVSDSVFGSMLARSGITPGASDPTLMSGRTGFLETIKSSNVVNDGGTRATFGYFVKVREGGFNVPVEYFVLFSYDNIVLDADGKVDPGGAPQNAFEMFVFGPLPKAGTGGALLTPEGQTPLIGGFAVNGSGELLNAVPLSIAHVKNYKDEEPDPNKPVTPGVSRQGEGCLECHSRNTKALPQTTGPFPWAPTFNYAGTPAPAPAAAPTPPEHSSATGSQHVKQGIGVEPPTLAHAGKEDAETEAQPAPKPGQAPAANNPTNPH